MTYGIIIVLAILICILLLPITAELAYKENAILKVSILKIPIFKSVLKSKKTKPSGTAEEKAQKLDKNTKKLGEKIDAFREFYKFTVKLLGKYVSLDEIKIKLDFGTGDAPSTAILIGALWGVLYGLVGRIGSICKIKKHNIEITPHYNEEFFSFEGKCIVKSNLVYIIIIAITILIKIKSRKGKEE